MLLHLCALSEHAYNRRSAYSFALSISLLPARPHSRPTLRWASHPLRSAVCFVCALGPQWLLENGGEATGKAACRQGARVARRPAASVWPARSSSSRPPLQDRLARTALERSRRQGARASASLCTPLPSSRPEGAPLAPRGKGGRKGRRRRRRRRATLGAPSERATQTDGRTHSRAARRPVHARTHKRAQPHTHTLRPLFSSSSASCPHTVTAEPHCDARLAGVPQSRAAHAHFHCRPAIGLIRKRSGLLQCLNCLFPFETAALSPQRLVLLPITG